MTDLAGVDVRDGILLELAHRVRNAGFPETAAKIESAWAAQEKTLPLETSDREALLQVLLDGPVELDPLCSVLLQEHERRLAGGH